MTGLSQRVSSLMFILLLSTSCAMLKPLPAAKVPAWTALPATVVQAMCAKLHSEGMGGTVNVVTTTEPLITRESLLGLEEAAGQDAKRDGGRMEAAITAGAMKLPVTVEMEEGASCQFRPVATAKGLRRDEMVLQFSPPFANPFERTEAGVLARLSLAGDAPQWYWIPVAARNEKWFAGMPLSLAVGH
jgi:hypothetical protein